MLRYFECEASFEILSDVGLCLAGFMVFQKFLVLRMSNVWEGLIVLVKFVIGLWIFI